MYKFLENVGVQEGSDNNQMDSHKKMLIALIVDCSTLVSILWLLLSLWIYQRKNSYKPHKKNGQISSTSIWFFNFASKIQGYL